MLLSVAAVVLLIASLNVANMMLARGTSRRKEIAIRLALGGRHADIVRQLLVEGFLLALVGGAAGLAVAYWSIDALVASIARVAPIDLVYTAEPDVRVLFATIGFCALSTLVFGLGPAWNLSRRNVLQGLKSGERGGTEAGEKRVFSRRNVLVMSQVALSLMLLSAAGSFIRSASRAARVEPGFRVDGEILAEVDAGLAGYGETRGREIYTTLLDRLRAVPGVESASLAATVPFGIVSLGRTIQREDGAPASKPTELACQYNIVGDDYFKTMGIPLLRGRPFSTQDAGSRNQVAIIDQAAADKLWPGGDAVGKHVRLLPGGNDPSNDVEVVGVAGRVQEGVVGERSQAHVYVPFGQAYQSDMTIHLKAEPRLIETVRNEIRAVDPRLPVLSLKTMSAQLDGSFDLWIVRTGARMFVIFGAVALLLASIGLYGLRAYTVSMRTREIGIRMALGADASDALGMMMREGLILTGIGAGVGLLLSVAAGKLLSNLLYRVDSFDPVVLGLAPAVLMAVSLVACYIPARRAARIDPMAALRDE
jgi:predicted permease